jgi:hypothetical protein
MATGTGADLGTALMDLIQSQRITAILYAAARLGIADLLAEGPATGERLAEQTGTHPPSLRRLLRALVTVGICENPREDNYELTAMGRLLAAGAEPSLKGWAIFEGQMLTRSWEALLESVRTGKNAAELAGVDDTFELMGRNPEAVAVFNDAMVVLTRIVIPAVLAAYDFGGIRTLMDVGGGYGQLLVGILRAHPSMRGIVFDLERCAAGAATQFAAAGVGDRAEFVAGSFFEAVPRGADAMILKSIIHDWHDERCVTILENCRRALPDSGKLLLVERLMPQALGDNADDRSVTLSDLNMLRGPGGSERTADEFRALLRRSGFEITRILPAGRVAVLETSPARR